MYSVSTQLGYSVVALCFVMKLPQIFAVWRAKSCRGLSLNSLLLEAAGYTISACYGFVHGFPVSAYGESVLLLGQSWVLLYLVLSFRGLLYSLLTLAGSALYASSVALVLGGAVPDHIMSALYISSVVFFVASKIIQLFRLRKTEDAGQLSALTWGMMSYGALVRILTSIVIAKDLKVMVNFLCMSFINILMTVHILYYRYHKQLG